MHQIEFPRKKTYRDHRAGDSDRLALGPLFGGAKNRIGSLERLRVGNVLCSCPVVLRSGEVARSAWPDTVDAGATGAKRLYKMANFG